MPLQLTSLTTTYPCTDIETLLAKTHNVTVAWTLRTIAVVASCECSPQTCTLTAVSRRCSCWSRGCERSARATGLSSNRGIVSQCWWSRAPPAAVWADWGCPRQDGSPGSRNRTSSVWAQRKKDPMACHNPTKQQFKKPFYLWNFLQQQTIQV